ncbi:MAG TPA: glycoside hydrolase family 9 protein, partial [Cyclobacteriaceae bacterium]|nr:glycoside hydrolase family 9 protein [Cyclobacteriaceae bacterium]
HNDIERSAQYNFIQAQALTARIFKATDPEYSGKCMDAAARCINWCEKNFYANEATDMGAALMAYIELYKTTGDQDFLEEAVVMAGRLIEIQVTTPVDNTYKLRGFFNTSSRDGNPVGQSWQGPQHVTGLGNLVELLPDHDFVPKWKESIRMYCEDYIVRLVELNNFELTPVGLYLTDPGTKLKIGNYWVRYLSVTANNAWGGGTNAGIASTGTCLLHAAKILNNDKLKSFAQRQLDWIVGLNPLNMSTAEGIGRNQPVRFINRSLNIPPLIEGAVMNGIGATIDDQPHMTPGSWQNCEYWTPPTVQTMLLMTQLQSALR